MPSKASNVRRPQVKESIIQIDGFLIMCGTIGKCSTGCGLSVHSNLIVLIHMYFDVYA